MTDKRSMFQNIFSKFTNVKQNIYTRLQMLSGYNPTFTTWGNNPYEADIVRSAVDSIARNAAKAKAKHIKRINGEISHVGGSIERILQMQPNPNMNAYAFQLKMVTTLLIENNAFAYPLWNGMKLESVWPINCTYAEFMEDNTKTIYVKFYFADGNNVILPYSEVIHLRRHYFKNDIMGDNNNALNNTLSAIHTSNQSISETLKSSAYLRGILKFQGALKEKDIKINKERFVDEYMSVQNNGGIAALDSKAEFQELNLEPKMINAAQMKELRENVYRYFGTNESIVLSQHNEQQWDAFYEGTIEPILIQMSLEFTNKLFTTREQGFGNEIIYEANRMQYVSAKTKKDIIKELAPMGILEIDECREILNLAPLPNGEGKKRIVSLNYINADKADIYQTGDGDNKDE